MPEKNQSYQLSNNPTETETASSDKVPPNIPGINVHERDLIEDAGFIQKIIDTSPALILVTDVILNKLVYINKTTEELFGYSRNQVPTFKREELVHPHDKETWINFFKQASELPDEAVCEAEYRIKNKRGEYIWLHNKSNVFKRDEKGNAWQILSICADITARKLAEEKLIESVKFNQHIADTVPDILSVYDLVNNKIIYLNRTTEEIFGYNTNEVAAMSPEEINRKIIHPEDHQRLLDFRSGFFSAADDEIKILEYRVKDKAGEWRYLRNKSKVFKRNEYGNVTHYISVVQDVTEQVKLNLQILEKNTFIETLVDANIDRIMAYDRNMNVTAWNKRCEEIYGIKKEEILGKPFF